MKRPPPRRDTGAEKSFTLDRRGVPGYVCKRKLLATSACLVRDLLWANVLRTFVCRIQGKPHRHGSRAWGNGRFGSEVPHVVVHLRQAVSTWVKWGLVLGSSNLA